MDDRYDKFLKSEQYMKHPIEDCVVRTEPIEDGWYTYIRFSKLKEYKPLQNSNIVLDAELTKEIVWISKEKYYNF